MRRLGLALVSLLAAGPAASGPLPFELGLYVPPVIADSTAPAGCTVVYLVADLANNDLFAARMRIDPAENATPVDNRMPCPTEMPPRVGLRALDVCTIRSVNAKQCVFADMARGFQQNPTVQNTAENASRCASDRASDIGVACWTAGGLSVCNVACGHSAQEAAAQARARCEEKQQHSCAVSATVPVAGP